MAEFDNEIIDPEKIVLESGLFNRPIMHYSAIFMENTNCWK